MNIIDDQYYKGYEGEPEIQFIEKLDDSTKKIFSIWDGYFDDIMELFQPTDHGWKGLSLHYHMYTGWYEESPWEIPDISNALEQFKELNAKELKFENSKNVLEKICEILCNAVENKQVVWIALE